MRATMTIALVWAIAVAQPQANAPLKYDVASISPHRRTRAAVRPVPNPAACDIAVSTSR